MYNRKAGGGYTTAWSTQKSAQKPEPLNRQPNNRIAQFKPKHAKSPEITRIEKLVEAIERGVDPKAGQQGCFCLGESSSSRGATEKRLTIIVIGQVRKHTLSIYTPICHLCGLILCELQSPASPCPSCFSPLLSDHDRASLLARLESEKDQELARLAEEWEAERTARAREREIASGGGEFPTLTVSNRGSGATTPQGSHTPTDQGGHKVLSLTGSSRHVTVQTIRTPPASAPTTRPASRAMTAEEKAEQERLKPVPQLLSEFDSLPPNSKAPEDRPWFNVRGPQLVYIPVDAGPEAGTTKEFGDGKKKSKRGGKGKGRGGASVGGHIQHGAASSIPTPAE